MNDALAATARMMKRTAMNMNIDGNDELQGHVRGRHLGAKHLERTSQAAEKIRP